MEIKPHERRFLVSFAEAALGLPDGQRAVAERAVDRLDQFLSSTPAAVRTRFHLALLIAPPLLTKARFARKPLAWRRAYVDRLFRKFASRPPGFLIDRQAILSTIKAMLGGSFCELPEFWQRIGYSPVPQRFPSRPSGAQVVPPTGPELRPGRSVTGQFLHDRSTRLADLPEQVDGRRTIAIIGGGAGGLTAAHALAGRSDLQGARIVVLEAGKLHTNESFPQRTLDGFSQLYFNAGVTPCRSQRIGFIQGRCVGGGTTVNNAGCVRPMNEWGGLVERRWGIEGADLDWGEVGRAFDDLRDPLHIRQVEPYVVTRGTQRTFDGFATLADHYVRAGLLDANLKDCVSCGQCNNGCPYDAHTAPFITLLPEALRRNPNVALVPEVEVTGIGFEGNGEGRRVSHLELKGTDGRLRRLSTDQVILAAGAFGSVELLLRSRFYSATNTRRLVGQRFSCNFASPVLGRFREEMDAGKGIQIGYIVEMPDDRMIIETAFAPPTVMGMMMPQWGSAFSEKLLAYNNFGVAFPTVSSDAYGAIDFPLLPPSDRAEIDFELAPSDWMRLVKGLRLCAEALRRAGAEEIFDSRYSGETLSMTGDARRDPERIEGYYRDAGPAEFFKVQSAHLQGGNVIHYDPTRGVVDRNLRVHGVQNLWILDSSVFPAAITLNIQYTTMALARYAALRMPA
ncbi:MAG: GMC family oxidoreductase N-terminal domain-containing protein [Gemmatimonadales bacterium]